MHIYVKKMVEGESIPGIIRNGNYFLTELGVYEDGTISCWERNDLKQFRDSIAHNRIVPAIPDGELLSIFQLGAFRIEKAEWLYNKDSYYNHIVEIIKSLNPEMENIYTETPRISEKWDKARVRFSDNPTDCKLREKLGYSLTDGKSGFIFCNIDGITSITFLVVYADKCFRIGEFPDKDFTFDEIKEMFRNGTLSTKVTADTWVNIENLGKVKLSTVSSVKTSEKLKELEEKAKRLANEPTAHEKCVNAYHQYLEYPCEDTKEALRKAYEAVPEYERCYLGDMDTRDTDYVRILYSNEKRTV